MTETIFEKHIFNRVLIISFHMLTWKGAYVYDP